jgi:hypothetical protein
MVTDEQVRLLRRKMEDGRNQEAAAAAAGMSARSARRWAKGVLPSQAKVPRSWRTRTDPLAEVWGSDVIPLLVSDTERALQATTVLDELRTRGRQVDHGMLRTLQRRIADWRAAHGPEREVYFEQQHPPGGEGAFDFTDGGELLITVRGSAFAHLWFEMVLTHSGHRSVSLAFSETFEALLEGLQRALADFGGVPAVFRSDNLSAATHSSRRVAVNSTAASPVSSSTMAPSCDASSPASLTRTAWWRRRTTCSRMRSARRSFSASAATSTRSTAT